jgi:hypothetical protein
MADSDSDAPAHLGAAQVDHLPPLRRRQSPSMAIAQIVGVGLALRAQTADPHLRFAVVVLKGGNGWL